jgi:hypothetical protein
MLGALIFSFEDVERSPEMSLIADFGGALRGPALILGGFQCGAARFVILLFSIAAALE